MKMMHTRNFSIKLLLLSLMHFTIDGLCAYLIFSRLYPNNPTLSVIIFLGYNLLAFVTQSPIGILIDKYNKPKLMIAVSVVSVILGYIFSSICLLAVFFIGIGNSFFHVAGGKYVTDKSGNDISHLGFFVSTGALGLVLGQRYFVLQPLIYIFFVLIAVCTLLFILLHDTDDKSYNEYYKPNKISVKIAMFAIIGVVFARSFVGKVVSPDFDSFKSMFLIIAFATAFGKAIGGICSKFFGINRTTIFSMIIAAVCLTVGTGNPIMFIIGVFAFNFSMPITLYYANILLKGREGFAFGTLAAILAPGYFLAISFDYSLPIRIITALLCILSIAIIFEVSRRIENVDGSIISDDTP